MSACKAVHRVRAACTGLALSCRAGAFALSTPGAGQLLAEIPSHQRKARQ